MKRRALLGRSVVVWRVVDCVACGAVVGVRCVLPNGTERKGSHIARTRRLWALRRQRRGSQGDLFPPPDL